jgi:hypothetical protein
MSTFDGDLEQSLASAAFTTQPSPQHAQAVHSQMLELARRSGPSRRHVFRSVAIGAVITALAGAGLGATEAGRNLVRRLLMHIEPAYEVAGTDADGSSWVSIRIGSGPFSPAEAAAEKTQMDEVDALKQAGSGRLVKLLEGPPFDGLPATMSTTFVIEYQLSSGETLSVGDSSPSPAQRPRMRLDEVIALRDAGADEVVSQSEGGLGLGQYTVRFTLSDGQTVELETWYPPGPRIEREALFAETRALKRDRQFVALDAVRRPDGGVFGRLCYTLADGRMPVIAEEIPADVITPDGQYVTTQASDVPVAIQGALLR